MLLSANKFYAGTEESGSNFTQFMCIYRWQLRVAKENRNKLCAREGFISPYGSIRLFTISKTEKAEGNGP